MYFAIFRSLLTVLRTAVGSRGVDFVNGQPVSSKHRRSVPSWWCNTSSPGCGRWPLTLGLSIG